MAKKATNLAQVSGRARVKAPSRKDTKAITGHFLPNVSKQLKQIALDEDSTIQALLAEALDDLFEKYGKPAIVQSGDCAARTGRANRDKE